MLKKEINKKLITWVTIATILATCVFAVLMKYVEQVRAIATVEMSSLYMQEMMYLMQDHFNSIVSIKSKEVAHISEHAATNHSANYREALCNSAESMDFEYLALYDSNGNYDTLLGEAAWYRDLQGFIDDILSGKASATTGYLTSTGGKYIVFGAPTNYPMTNGNQSAILLAGFSVEKLYDYIDLDDLVKIGSNAYVGIILKNGSYVLKDRHIEDNSFFDYIKTFGDFIGMNLNDGVSLIEDSMAANDNFSCTVTINGEPEHIYGAPAGEPVDWYFIISMPQGASDQTINRQNIMTSHAFLLSGAIMLLIILVVFILYMRLSNQQITETENARRDAETAKSYAETANNAKSTFLSNMSHDIRTPMNAIVGYASIIEKCLETGETDKAFESINKLNRSSGYLRSLISDVLDMSKIESGMLTLAPEPMSLQKVIDTVSTIVSAQTAAKRQHYELNVHNIIHDAVICDHTRLNQILINLLGNAVKFTPENGKITLDVCQENSGRGDEYVCTKFIVKDTGIGISSKFIENIFDSFAREDSKVRKIEGTGLGLTITRSLVDMMNGTISVESTEEVGSTFYVTLDLPKASVDVNMDTPHFDSEKIQGMHILIAEDNEFNYDIAKELLESNGFVTEHAENGQIAVDMYYDNPFKWDLILMDLRMPVLDGYKAAVKIRNIESMLPDNRHVPILALSADVFSEDIEHCYAAGMEGHIAKPIDINELLQVLHKNL